MTGVAGFTTGKMCFIECGIRHSDGRFKATCCRQRNRSNYCPVVPPPQADTSNASPKANRICLIEEFSLSLLCTGKPAPASAPIPLSFVISPSREHFTPGALNGISVLSIAASKQVSSSISLCDSSL